MPPELSDIVQVRRIPPDRRIFAQTEMARIAGELGNEALKQRIEANIEHDRTTLALDLQRREGQLKPQGRLPETITEISRLTTLLRFARPRPRAQCCFLR